MTIPSELGGYPVVNIGAVNTRTSIFADPASVTSIGERAFSGKKLREISVDAGNAVYSSDNGVLYDKAVTNLIAYPNAKEDTEYARRL